MHRSTLLPSFSTPRALPQLNAAGSYEGSNIAPVFRLDADSIVRISERVVLQAAAAGNCIIVAEYRNTSSGTVLAVCEAGDFLGEQLEAPIIG